MTVRQSNFLLAQKLFPRFAGAAEEAHSSKVQRRRRRRGGRGGGRGAGDSRCTQRASDGIELFGDHSVAFGNLTASGAAPFVVPLRELPRRRSATCSDLGNLEGTGAPGLRRFCSSRNRELQALRMVLETAGGAAGLKLVMASSSIGFKPVVSGHTSQNHLIRYYIRFEWKMRSCTMYVINGIVQFEQLLPGNFPSHPFGQAQGVRTADISSNVRQASG